MYQRNIIATTIFFTLVGCAQTPPKTVDNTPQVVQSTVSRPANVQLIAYNPSNHAAGQDITYNSQHPPHFPIEAIRAGHYGTVILMVPVNAEGEVGEIRVDRSSGYPELDASAIDAVKQWKFTPEVKNGVAQSGYVRIPVDFGRPIPPPGSTDGLVLGSSTQADARVLLGAPTGTMRYTSGVTQMMWGNRSVGMVILTFDANGKLSNINRSAPLAR